MLALEIGILAAAALGWAGLAFLDDVIAPPPRPRGERSPFYGVDYGVE